MGTLLTNRDHFQALIIPDQRFEPWDAQTTAAPDGGRANVSTSSGLHLEPVDLDTGAPASDLTITCVRSGLPAPTDGNQAAAYTVQHGSGGTVYGLDECYHLTGVTAAIDSANHGQVALAVSSQERLVVAATDLTTSTVRAWGQHNDTAAPVKFGTALSAALRGNEAYPTAYAYGDGLVRVLYADVDYTQESPIRVGVTTIDGSTVALDGVDVLGDGLNRDTSSPSTEGAINAITRMSAAARGEEVLLVVAVDYHSTTSYRSNALSTLRQYASTDGGLSFRYIGELADDSVEDAAGAPVVVATDSGFVVYYARWRATPGNCPIFRRAVGSAYAPLSASVAVETLAVSTGSIASGVLTVDERPIAWVDHRGQHFLGTDEDVLIRSADTGLTWVNLEGWARQSSLDSAGGWSAAFHRGQAVIAVDRVTGGVSSDYSISLAHLGGWSDLTWPESPSGDLDYKRPKWEQVYLPCGGVQRLSNVTVTATAITQTLDDSVNRLTSTSSLGNARIAVDLGTITATRGAAFEGSGTTTETATAGGLLVEEFPITWDLDVVDGISQRYGLRVTHEDGELRLLERTGSSSFALQATVAITDDRADVRIVIENGKGRAFYKTQGSTATKGAAALRDWVPFTAAITLTNAHDASAPATSTANVFSRMASGDSSDLHWFGVRGDGSVDYNLEPMITGTGYNLRGAEYAYRPLYLSADVVVRAVGGAARAGDTHEVSAAYDRGLDAALTADPRAGFKEEAGATGDLSLAYFLAGSGGDDVVPPGELIGVALVGANFAKYKIQVHTGGAWSDALDVDEQIAVAWVREGLTVRPDTANNTSGPMVKEGEFVGGMFLPDTTTTATGDPIVGCVGGQWTSDYWRPQLQLETAPTASSGTNGAIVPKTSCAIFAQSDGIQGVRIVVDEDERTRADRPLEVGRIVIGRVLPHGTAYSWGRVVTMEAGAVATELRDKSSRRVVDAQPRRVVEVAWADGLPTLGASTDEDDPDYYSLTSSNVGQAAKNATAWEVFGILQALNGAQPVVYLPRVERSSGTTITISRRDAMVYGRLEGDARWEVVLGEELIDEVVRGLGFTIRELV